VALRRGLLRAAAPVTVAEAASTWLAGARAGAVRNRSGDIYKPSALRGYETSLRLRVLPAFGAARLSEITRADLQALVDRMLAEGIGASTLRNTLMPLRAIYRRALARGEVAVNPTSGLELPAVRGRRERIATPAEVRSLLDALAEDHALWGTAVYAGLRRGELRALRWEDVDLDGGVIRVSRGWDAKEGPIEPKSRAGTRTVPIPAALRRLLLEHRLRADRPRGLVFGRTEEHSFDPSTVMDRARRIWGAAGLADLTLHDCRHTYASLMIVAGVNAKALCSYMGHASVTITFDRYGHLMPGNEAEAAGLLDRLLEEA
jgi:integrase